MKQHKPRIVVKLGSSVLTRSNQRLNYNKIHDLAIQVAELVNDFEFLLVSSGAVAAGKEFSDFGKEKDFLVRQQMLASIGQSRLLQVYVDAFQAQGLLVAQALLTKGNFAVKSSFYSIKNTLEGLLHHGVVPIINENDVISDADSTFGDNDHLAAMTAATVEADRLVFLTDSPGFFTADPRHDQSAKLIERVEKITPEILAYCQQSLSEHGRGGMYSKVKAAELATEYGITTIVTSGSTDNVLQTVLVNERFTGTLFVPQSKKKLKPRGAWMQRIATTKGSVVIDSGALTALKANKSLLAVGVESILGEFNKGDVLVIQNNEDLRVGVGLAHHDSQFLQAKIHNRQQHGLVAIHKNNLYMLENV